MIYSAPHILCNSQTLIKDGALLIKSGQIADVGTLNEIRSAYPLEQVNRFDNAVMLPGLINAHCHLELTLLQNKIEPGPDFASWIRTLVDLRRRWNKSVFHHSMQRGLDALIQSGTTTVVDISSQHIYEPLLKAPLRKLACFEVFTLDANESVRSMGALETLLAMIEEDEFFKAGVSPHAPYTVAPELYGLCADLAQKQQRLLTTHLAETKAEIEFLASGQGPLRELYQSLGYDMSAYQAPRKTPAQYIYESCQNAPRILFAHGTYLAESDFALLQKHGAAVVYCPRCTHEYFKHPQHPWKRMQAAGIPVCLGTDSLASNFSLSLRDEIDYLIKRHPEENPNAFWTMATETAAEAIGMGALAGKLEKGFYADFGVWELCESAFSYNAIGALQHSFVSGQKIK